MAKNKSQTTDNKIHFATIFNYGIENLHFKKELFKIPHYLSQYQDFKVTFIALAKEQIHKESIDSVKGVKVRIVGTKKSYSTIPNLLLIFELIKLSNKIQILNLYHLNSSTIVYGIIYKLINPHGKIYLKLDIDLRPHDFYTKKNIISKIKRHFLYKYTKHISVENKLALNNLIQKFPDLEPRILYLPSGIDVPSQEVLNAINQNIKENIIITVGRIGTRQKNNELLLKAITNIELNGWKVYIIGKIEDTDYLKFIDEYYINYPHLKDIVIHTGLIENTEKMIEFYTKSKIFCLTSSWESFGLVLIEAILYGNFVISTNIESINEISDNGKYAKIIEKNDDIQLAEAIKMGMQYVTENENNIKLQQDYICNHFDWQNIVHILRRELINKI
ncbi:MAG: glycosyltransferase [Cytophagales bacterium]|nr:glycosyltransferase [Cytophagales bacterium]